MKKFGNLFAWALAALLAAAPILSSPPARAQFASQATYAVGSGTSAAMTATLPNVATLDDLRGVPITIKAGVDSQAGTTLSVSSLAALPIQKPGPNGPLGLVGTEIKTGQNFTVVLDDAEATYQMLSAPAALSPTYVNLLSGSGTYTPAAGVVRIKIRMIAGGGGGAGCSGGTSGGVGGTTIFGAFTVVGGQGGADCPGISALGGTGGVGTAALRIPGGRGNGGSVIDTSSGAVTNSSAAGCSSFFGGAGAGIVAQSAGNPAVPNTGSGGGAGAGFFGSNDTRSGSSGACGEYAELTITNPTPTSYTVGAPGAASTGVTFHGGLGASGAIYIEEQYQ